jgi:uncharacterized protein (TIGR02246 family)
MKRLFLLFGFVCLIALILPVCAPVPEPEPEPAPEPLFDQAAEEAAIRKVAEQVTTAMNNHDAAAFVAFFADNYETWDGETKGIEAYQQSYSDTFEQAKDIAYEFQQEIGIIFLKPDVAIYKARGVFTNMPDDDGNVLPPQEMRHAWILMKEDGRWLIAANFTALEEGAA